MNVIIDGITHQGEGVGRAQGKAVFIPFTILGEEISIEIINEQKRFSRGKIKEIITPSPDRVEAPCQHFYQCGGCSHQHVNYQRHLQLKKQVVSDALQRIGKQEAVINDVIGMGNPWNYRNKVTWHIGENNGVKRLGYYQINSRRHLPISDCLIISPEIMKFSKFLDVYLDITGMNRGQQVVIRQDTRGKLYLIVEGPVDEAGLESLVNGYPDLKSLLIYQDNKLQKVFGSGQMDFIIGDRQYLVSPLAFFQVNNEQTKLLYDQIKIAVGDRPDQRILDAYCGTGSIAIYAAGKHDTVLGIDAFAPGIADARMNAELNHMANCEFAAGACEKILPEINKDFDIAILDPPRAGCHQDLLNAVIAKEISQIIYVSCNPATMARDIKILCASAYKTVSVQPVDMFPWTSHVECVILMQRSGLEDEK